MRSLILAAVAAIALAPASFAGTTGNGWSANAGTPPGPYTRDDKGNCHAANGHFVDKKLCGESVGPYTVDAKGNCHASDGHYVKRNLCGEPPKH